MRFLKGHHYPHPPRGHARGRYHMSDVARRARRQNLSKSRLRSDQESLIIKLLIWQSSFSAGPCPSHRTLARELGVCPSYVCKVQKQSEKGLEMLTRGQRATFDDLHKARRFTARLKKQEPGLLSPLQSSRSERPRVPTEDEVIAKNWCEVNEWKRKTVPHGGRGWFRW